jgi:probable F420-dependent oxidoreductase
VKVRIAIGLGASTVDANEFASTVHAVARSRFDSLWVSEVLTAPGPDPLVALAVAAALEPQLKLGTTMLLPGRHEVRLAKALATLDVLSGGRLLLTFVPGLSRGAERAAVGVAVGDRGEAIERTLPKLRRWWAGEEVDGLTVRPTPIQQPLEPWLGSLAPSALVRCGRLADGWLGAACSPAEAAAARTAIETAADSAGRLIDPEHFGMSIGYGRAGIDDRYLAGVTERLRGRDVDPRDVVPIGYEAVRTMIEAYVDAGISKFVLRPLHLDRPWPEELDEVAAAVANLQT